MVEYDGKLAVYGGLKNDESDNIQKFELIYGDLRELCPMQYFSSMSKYSGNKTMPDNYSTKKVGRRLRMKTSLEEILGYNAKEIKLANYSGFMVSSNKT